MRRIGQIHSPHPALGWAGVALVALALNRLGPHIGDEPYFVSWGLDLAWGYYDHPPLIGWLSAALNRLGEALGLGWHGELHRLAYILLGLATWLGLGAYFRQRYPDLDTGRLLLAFAAAPAAIFLFGIYLNDTLLGLGILLFFISTERALFSPRGRFLWPALAGIGLGSALLTKYIAGLFFIAMLLYLAASPARRRYLFGRFVITVALAAALFAQNLLWNLDNCNVNLAFNFAFRQMQAGLRGLPLFALQIALLLGPVLFFLLAALYRRWRAERRLGYYGALFLLVLLLGAASAVSRGTFRMNWGMPYILFALLAAAETLRGERVLRLLRWNLGYMLAFSLPFLTLFALEKWEFRPVDRFLPEPLASRYNLYMDFAYGNLAESLRPLNRDHVLATSDYGQTAYLRNLGLEAIDFPIRADLGVFGRNGDLFTDYAAYEGRDFLFLVDEPAPALSFARQVFDRVEPVQIQGRRQLHNAIRASGFRFDAYRRTVILPAMARYYDRYRLGARGCFMDRYREAPAPPAR